jgi:hypothetical protein
VSNVLNDPLAPSGYTMASGFALARLNPDGSPDATFGGRGGAAAGVVLSTSGASLTDVAVDADGRVWACGNASGVTVMRFRADGTPDAAFGSGGTTTLAGGALARAGDVTYRMELLAGGGVAVSGVYGTAGQVRVFNSGGTLDRSVDLSAGSFGSAAAAVGPDGRLLVAGTIYPANSPLTSDVDSPAWEAWLASADVYAARFDLGEPVVPAQRADLDLIPAPTFDTPEPAKPEPAPQPSPSPTPVPPVTPPVVAPPVTASLVGKALVRSGRSYKFNVTFSSSAAINLAVTQGVQVSGPNGFEQSLTPSKVKRSKDGRRVIASYCAAAPGGAFDADDNGTYTVVLDGPSNVTSDAPQVRALQSGSGGMVLGRFVVSIASRSRTARRDAAAAPGVGTAATVAAEVLGSKT